MPFPKQAWPVYNSMDFSEMEMISLQDTAEFSGCFEIELNAAYGYPKYPIIDHRKVHLI